MNEHTGSHWAEREDLREQFVLGKVPASQRAALEAHLQDCAECRRRVEEERTIARGVRAVGRESLRADLNDRLRSRQTPVGRGTWQWIAAAATIVAAIGVWRLMTPGQPGVLTPPEVPRIVEQPATEPAYDDSVRGGDTDGPARDENERTGELSARSEIALEEERRREIRPSVLDAAGAGAREDVAKREVADAELPQRAEAWTTGFIVSAPTSAAPSMPPQGQQMQRALEFEAKAQKDAGSTGSGVVSKVATAHHVQLRQSNVAHLPAEQMRRQGPAVGSFPVRLTQVGDSLIIDLYLDPPFSGDGLRTARYLLPKTDSIVVEIESQKIGIQLPSGFIAR